MDPARLKRFSLLALVVVAALGLLAWSQSWFTLVIDGAPLTIGGDVAGGALIALVLSAFASTAALALAGPFFRVVLSALIVLLGLTAVTTTVLALLDPVVVSAPAITEVTGVAGSESLANLVSSVTVSVWPYVALVAGALLTVVGVLLLATVRRWPSGGRRYTRTRTHAAPASARDAAIDDWDSLSDGEDPTAR